MATSNRFKKSIEKAIDNTQENILDSTTENIPHNIKSNTLDITQTNTSQNINNDILKKILGSGKKDKGSNHTLYLSADVGESLVKLAKKCKKSKSTLVNEILREVLLNQ
ncbi:MAG: hypothetical protein FWD05_09175 [Oscillospiraceae bacterium]|nr:hypothetical protein [Oscillospiraceae bacterium]